MKRNYGIDLLRMVLMLMVVLLHLCNQGGVSAATQSFYLKNSLARFLITAAFCAVDCYALISGYVHFGSRYRFSSLIQLWLQGLFYSMGIAALVWVLIPGTFSIEKLVYYLFPVAQGGYWYLTAYFGMFFLIPLLNAGVAALSDRQQTKTYLWLLFVVFTVIPTLACRDTFTFKDGFSPFWLACLYFAGACIKKFGFGDNLKPGKGFLLYVICVVFSIGMKLIPEAVAPNQTVPNFVTYTSPTMVLAAAGLFFAFKNAKIPHWLHRVIACFSPASFGVYLIHQHRYSIQYFMTDRFTFLADWSAPMMVLGALGCSFLLFLACLLLDWLRHQLFLRLHVKEFLQRLEQKYIPTE